MRDKENMEFSCMGEHCSYYKESEKQNGFDSCEKYGHKFLYNEYHSDKVTSCPYIKFLTGVCNND